MRNILFLSLGFLLLFFKTKAQESSFTQSGYTSLIINFTGDYPDSIDLSIPHWENPVSRDKPSAFKTINDSTYFLSFYTFGPSTIFFYFNKKYLTSILLPNQTDTLEIHYSNKVNYTANYRGHFKEIFDNSDLLAKLIKNSYEYGGGNGIRRKKSVFKTANEFRDFQLSYIESMTNELSKDVRPEVVKDAFILGTDVYFKYLFLLDDYNESIILYNKNIGLDSVDARKFIPKRDLSFYEGILSAEYENTASLISSSYSVFINGILRDSLLNLPSIREGPNVYAERLKQCFSPFLPGNSSLLYDMMVANAYTDLISTGQLLTEKDKYQIERYFKNRHITNYIFYQNDLNGKQNNNIAGRKYHLPFEKQQDSVLSDILSKYKGKAIVIDFWATWCGPCIAAHDEIKKVKERYAGRDDVEFVYITNESSDLGQWNEYVKVLSGEHYYLYNNQNKNIEDKYGIDYIPSYLIFNRYGKLIEVSRGGYMGNQKTIEWIEEALDE